MDFQDIKTAILESRVIAFLGHSLTVNYGDKDREKVFFEKIFQENKKDIRTYNAEDKFLIFNSKTAKSKIRRKTQPFYEQDFGSEMLNKLTQIPLHAYVCLAPDMSLVKSFENQGFDFLHTYWNDTSEGNMHFTKEKPLIYHLFGTVKDAESLIISHYDLFEYIKRMHADGHQQLQKVFADIFDKDRYDYILFLGCDFDKWYFQLVLNLLKIGFDYDAYEAFAVDSESRKNTWQDVYEQYFKVEFVEENQIDDFIDELYGQFEPKELRKPSEVKSIRKFNKKNLFNLLFEGFNDSDLKLLCQLDNDFGKVYANFTVGQEKAERIEKIIDYAQRFLLTDKLLRLAQERNPVMYERHKPYEDE
jgi:hypothetical protein